MSETQETFDRSGAVTAYVTRKHPPRAGGMEQLAWQLAALLRQRAEARVVAWDGAAATLPAFLGGLAGVTRAAARGEIAHLVVGDVALAAAWPGLAAGPGRRVVVAHGLDVIWRPAPYQWAVRNVLPRFERVVALSAATRAACLARGVLPERCVQVAPFVEPPNVRADRAALAARWGQELASRPLLLGLGRLVARKGFAWFAGEVLPRLPGDVVWLLAGEGPEAPDVVRRARAAGVEDRVRVLGAVSEAERGLLLGSCDALVLPNRSRAGDLEGFGLVAVEAAMAGLPVVAAAVDGLCDAVVPGVTGVLVPPDDAAAFAVALADALGAAEEVRTRASREARARFGPAALREAWVKALLGSS